MSARPNHRVLETLRRRIVSGALPPGQLLPVAELSSALRVSATPVREALAHLAGEGLVEDSHGRGYLCRQLTETDYRAACDMQERLLSAAVLWRPERRGGATVFRAGLDRRRGEGAGVADATAWLFEALVASAGNGCLIELHAGLSGRLGAARRAEAGLLEATGEELEEVAESLDAADRLRLDARLDAYHARRRAAADLICEHLRQRLRSDPVFRAGSEA